MTMLSHRTILRGATAVAVLATGAMVAVAAAHGRFDGRSTSTACSAPTLPGAVVDATLIDMHGMGMMNRSQGQWRTWHAGMMRIAVTPSTVRAGSVSLRVRNSGTITHELVVLPLTGAQRPGARAVGTDGKVSETGSRGEVSATCSAGAGDGLAASSTGWTTMTLPAGRYELICNLPGHYAAGMFAELDITG